MSNQEPSSNPFPNREPALVGNLTLAGLGKFVLSGSGEVGKSPVGLGMSLDKDMLLATPLPPHITDQAKINELGAMVENFAKLPE
ncbi:MAG: hypothetical protein ACRDF4_10475, partial [Rhabdochlamydiaceae bacterium]